MQRVLQGPKQDTDIDSTGDYLTIKWTVLTYWTALLHTCQLQFSNKCHAIQSTQHIQSLCRLIRVTTS